MGGGALATTLLAVSCSYSGIWRLLFLRLVPNLVQLGYSMAKNGATLEATYLLDRERRPRNWRVPANLLGLTTFKDRFEMLHALFQLQLQQAIKESPPVRTLRFYTTPKSFQSYLSYSDLFMVWEQETLLLGRNCSSLAAFLLRHRAQLVQTALNELI